MADADAEESRRAPAADRNAGACGTNNGAGACRTNNGAGACRTKNGAWDCHTEKDDDGLAPEAEVNVNVGGNVDIRKQPPPAATSETTAGEEPASYGIGAAKWEQAKLGWDLR
jgi:hypothetical protein